MATGFSGTWKIDNSQTVGYDDFMSAQGFSTDVTEKFRNMDMTMNNVEEEDGWKTLIKAGEDFNKTINWKFGEQFETTDLLGNMAKIKPLLQGDTIVEEVIFKTPNGEANCTLTMKINGDVMTRVMKDDMGNSFSQVWTKC